MTDKLIDNIIDMFGKEGKKFLPADLMPSAMKIWQTLLEV